MRYFILSIFFLALVGCQPSEQAGEEAAPETAAEEATSEAGSVDPTVTEADHYAVEFENDDVRVVRVTYAANDETDMHSHPDLVAVFLGDGTYAFALEDGTEEERTGKAAEAIWMPAETHAVKALIDNEGILVEVKGSGGEVEIADTNATVSDADHHQVEFENDRVRIVRMTYPAGHKTPPHDHLPGVNIMLTDYQATNTPEGEGAEAVGVEGNAGDVSWADAGPVHVSENIGEEAFSLVRVEIK